MPDYDSRKFIAEKRASSIIYNFVSSQPKTCYIIPSNICPVVPITLLKANIEFVLVDISLDDYLIDREKVLNIVAKNYKKIGGIIFVRTYGFFNDQEEFFLKLKEINNRFLIIDDRCLCIPSFSRENKISNADLILYSTGYSKYIDLGEGGFAYIKNELDYTRSRIEFKQHSLNKLQNNINNCLKNNEKFEYSDSSWLLNDALALSEIEYKKNVDLKLKNQISHKAIINQIYFENLPKDISLPHKYQNWRYNILIRKKEDLLEMIFKHGYFASSHYRSLSVFLGENISKNSQTLAADVINLFNNERVTDEMAFKTTRIINKFFKDNL